MNFRSMFYRHKSITRGNIKYLISICLQFGWKLVSHEKKIAYSTNPFPPLSPYSFPSHARIINRFKWSRRIFKLMKWPRIDGGLFYALYKIIRSDEGLTLETSALKLLWIRAFPFIVHLKQTLLERLSQKHISHLNAFREIHHDTFKNCEFMERSQFSLFIHSEPVKLQKPLDGLYLPNSLGEFLFRCGHRRRVYQFFNCPCLIRAKKLGSSFFGLRSSVFGLRFVDTRPSRRVFRNF